MKIFEYEGLTDQEAWRAGQSWRFNELVPSSNEPKAIVKLSPGAVAPSGSDRDELKRFAGYLRQRSD